MALSKTGRFLSKAEILGWGSSPPLQVCTGGSFRKGCEFLSVSLGRGSGSGSGGWWGGGTVFLLKTREKGKAGVGRVGDGVGTGKETGKSMRKFRQNCLLANYSLVFCPM